MLALFNTTIMGGVAVYIVMFKILGQKRERERRVGGWNDCDDICQISQ